MSVITFRSGNEETTKVKNDFIKNEMPKMSGDHVKIYLYMLMLSSSGSGVDIENVADTFGIFTSEVIKILEHLNNLKLIHFARNGENFELSFDETISPAPIETNVVAPMPQIKIDEELVTAYSSNIAKPVIKEQYTQEELAYIFVANNDLDNVKCYIEEKYGLTFNPSALQELVSIVDSNLVPCSVIIDIVDYLHLNETKIVKLPSLLKAIENKAIDINEKGLKDPDDIRDYLTNSDPLYKKVLKSFGLYRDVAPADKAYIDRWSITYHMPIEVINYAIEKSFAAISQASFPYVDKILLAWNEQNIHTLKEAQGVKTVIKKENVDAPASTNKFNNYSKQNTINDKELENMTNLFEKYN